MNPQEFLDKPNKHEKTPPESRRYESYKDTTNVCCVRLGKGGKKFSELGSHGASVETDPEKYERSK